MPTIKARIAADNPDMDGFQTISVYGNTLTREYQEIDVDDVTSDILKGNPTIDVMVRKPASAPAAPVVAPVVAPTAAEPAQG